MVTWGIQTIFPEKTYMILRSVLTLKDSNIHVRPEKKHFGNH